MSYWIEYQAICMSIDAGFRGSDRQRYAIAIEGGASNVTERSRTGQERRARDWMLGMVGTAEQVLRQAVATAADCESGGLRVRGRRLTPEAYIGRVRRLLNEPATTAVAHLDLKATVPGAHPLVARARAFGLNVEQVCRHGEEHCVLTAVARNGTLDWGAFFRVVNPLLDDGTVLPYQLGDVWALPRS